MLPLLEWAVKQKIKHFVLFESHHLGPVDCRSLTFQVFGGILLEGVS
jgi:hypothetical protein